MLILCSSHMVSYIVSAAFSGTASAMAADISARRSGCASSSRQHAASSSGVAAVTAAPAFVKKSRLYSYTAAIASISTMGRAFAAASVTLIPPGFVR